MSANSGLYAKSSIACFHASNPRVRVRGRRRRPLVFAVGGTSDRHLEPRTRSHPARARAPARGARDTESRLEVSDRPGAHADARR